LKRKVIFRADGNSKIGFGHFFRTLALAELLEREFYCVFAIQNPTEFQSNEIDRVCHNIINLPEDETHFNTLFSLLNGDEIVVLDNYYFNTNHQNIIRSKGCKLVCIDDMHDKHYIADIVINHAIYDPSKFDIEGYTKLFLGIEYALIRKEFRNIKLENGIVRGGILISFGCSKNDLTQKILEYVIVNNLHIGSNVYVVAGSEDNLGNTFRTFCINHGVRVYCSIGAGEIAKLMASCKYAILPTSTIAIEALYAGIHVIGGYFVKNQLEFYKLLKSRNLITPIGNFNTKRNYVKLNPVLTEHKFSKSMAIARKHDEIVRAFHTL